MNTDLFGILGRALDPQSLAVESTSAAIDAMTKNRFERMSSEQRKSTRLYYQRNIAMEEGKYPRPKGATPRPWMLEGWRNELNQLERTMRGKREI